MPPQGRRYGGKKSDAGPSRSQATRRSTQGGTQEAQGTQRGRRGRNIEEEEEEQEEEEQEEDDGEDDTGAQGTHENMERCISLLVRLALSIQHSKSTLRRDQINKTVFPTGSTRGFNTALKGANDQLRKHFGFELVELMTRAERDQVGAANEDEDAPGRKKAAATSKTYILRSALDPSLVSLANKTDAKITAAGQADLDRLATRNNLVNAADDEIIAAFSRAGTSILGWDAGGDGESDWYNIMCVILGLVLVNGRSVADHTLKRLLKPLGLTPTTEMLLPVSIPRRRMRFPDFLGHLMKLGYLERQKANSATGPTATQQARKRGRQSTQATQDDDDDGAAIEWRWGSRAHAEIGEKAIAEFMVNFMVERAMRDATKALRRQARGEEDAEQEEEEEIGRTERAKDKVALAEREQKMREAMTRDVERSAGGHLSEIGRGLR